jgi:hypothetical protein
MNIEPVISTLGRAVLQSFIRLVHLLQDPPPNGHIPDEDHLSLRGIQDELGRYKIWAGNIGALQKGPSSLDYRLREASHVQQPIIRLLRDLEYSLKEGE